MMLYMHICVKFHQNIWNGFQLTEGSKYIVEMTIFNIYYVQRAATPKVG